ncbi:MAG TPA: nuclear transport factor 2 family protein [Capillimicrobium sp.]|jgi:ketosteroid isomerase-like protein
MDAAERTVRDLFAAFAARDGAASVSVLHPEVEFWAQPTGELAAHPEPYRGHDGYRAYLADVERVWERLSVDPRDFRVAGSGVIAFGSIDGVARGGERLQGQPVIWVFRLRDGLIAYGRVAKSPAEARALAGGGG